jgi:hypothetical protein
MPLHCDKCFKGFIWKGHWAEFDNPNNKRLCAICTGK